MKREDTLLDRLSADDYGRITAGPSATEDLDALTRSVGRNLQRLLNARHGMSEAVPDYGLPVLNDLLVGVGEHLQQVLDSIRTSIERYEPRLRRVRVTQIADEERPQRLAFRIDAVLTSRSGDHKLWYESRLDGSGRLSVSD